MFSATGLVLSILNTTMFLSPVLKHTDLKYQVNPPSALMAALLSFIRYTVSANILRRKKCSTRTRSRLDKYTSQALHAHCVLVP